MPNNISSESLKLVVEFKRSFGNSLEKWRKLVRESGSVQRDRIQPYIEKDIDALKELVKQQKEKIQKIEQ
jgi:geranylgeranyl pyrophosphate synthase